MMDPFTLAAHLEDSEPKGHELDWVEDLDAEEARRLHRALHDDRPVFPVGHSHDDA